MPLNLPYNEQTLLSGLAEGSKDAFAAIYKSLYPSLFHSALKILDNSTEAEDIVADTFIKLWKARQQFSTMAEIAAWLRRTTRNATLDILKHHRIKNRKTDEIVNSIYSSDQYTTADLYSELLKEIYFQIEQLPPKSREIFKLRYIEGCSNEEIAEKLGINNQSVRDHVARALKALRLEMLKTVNLFSFFLLWINTK